MDEKIEKASEQTPKFTEPKVRQDKIWKAVALIAVCAVVFTSVGYYAGLMKEFDTFIAQNEYPKRDDLSTERFNLQTKTVITEVSSETAQWKTYKNATYGISFKYPNNWTESDDNMGGDGAVFGVQFKNTQNTIKTPGAIENVYLKVYKNADKKDLATWLIDRYRRPQTELESYSIGKQIDLGGVSGFYSSIGCCASFDDSYNISKDGYIFSLGKFGADEFSKLDQIAETFNFTIKE